MLFLFVSRNCRLCGKKLLLTKLQKQKNKIALHKVHDFSLEK